MKTLASVARKEGRGWRARGLAVRSTRWFSRTSFPLPPARASRLSSNASWPAGAPKSSAKSTCALIL